ncbi:MAG: hypothetical protein R3F29_03750 [Planctomycetota bacterium]
MRLDAVYLVAPKPKPPSVPTRRAFLVAGATFCAGLGLGGACGYVVGVGKGGGPEEESAEPELVSSGDALLDELRRLATKAPIEELIEKRDDFVRHLYKTYPRDVIAWKGIGRLAEASLSGAAIADRRIFSRYLAQVIAGSDSAVRPEYEHYVDPLRLVK